MKPSIVVIHVSGGVVQKVECEDFGINVIVRDYDCMATDEGAKIGEDGFPFVEEIHEF